MGVGWGGGIAIEAFKVTVLTFFQILISSAVARKYVELKVKSTID